MNFSRPTVSRNGATRGQALASAQTAHFEPIGDIVGDIHPGKQAVLLEDHGVHRAGVADLLLDVDRAARGAIEPGDDNAAPSSCRSRSGPTMQTNSPSPIVSVKSSSATLSLRLATKVLLQTGEDDLRARRSRFGVDRLCRDHRSATRPSVASAPSSGGVIDRLFQIGHARENALFDVPGLLVQKALRRERPVRINIAPLHAIVQTAILDQRMRDDRIDNRFALATAAHRIDVIACALQIGHREAFGLIAVLCQPNPCCRESRRLRAAGRGTRRRRAVRAWRACVRRIGWRTARRPWRRRVPPSPAPPPYLATACRRSARRSSRGPRPPTSSPACNGATNLEC